MKFVSSSRAVLFALLLALVCQVAQAQKIKVEFDKNVDFSKLKTYAWDPTPQATESRFWWLLSRAQ